MKKVRIQKISGANMFITLALTLVIAAVSVVCGREFQALRDSTDDYIECENAARQLQSGTDYLAEQVRLYTATAQREYMDLYFEEANITRRREDALEYLEAQFEGSEAFATLETAMSCSQNLMYTDRYAMRLVAEATLPDSDTWPDELRSVALHRGDDLLSDSEKLRKAQQLVCSSQYQNMRNEMTDNIAACTDSLIDQTRSRQQRAADIFSDIYLKFEFSVAALILLVLGMSLIVRHFVVKPLMLYQESIRKGVIFPVVGVAELQELAVTYNKVYQENQETQKIIRHEAEHDALTDALNRGSFDKVLDIYEKGQKPFAMILCDVDTFKSVNDTYGHAVGDAILKKVASLLKTTFRSIDYVCRIGGDEFAVIMVDMNTELDYTIREKIAAVNEALYNPEDGLPAVSLSVGVAITDRRDPGESIFKDADKALYHIKQNGRHGCGFYGEDAAPDTN